MEVSKKGSTPKSSNFMGFSMINQPFLETLIYGTPHINGDFRNRFIGGTYHL